MKISPQYVSTVKSSMKAKGKKRVVKRLKPGHKAASDDHGDLAHALDFIHTSGGIQRAKDLLQTVEQKLGSLIR